MKMSSQSPDGILQSLEPLRPACLRLSRIVPGARAIPGGDAEHGCQDDPWNDARHEQGTDRGVGRHRVHDHHDRRRNQDAETPGGRDHPGAEAFRKPRLDHRRQQDGADRDHGRRTGSGYRGKQRAGQHPAERETAVPVADHRRGEVDHALRHPAVRQEVARQDEERDRHDLELFDAGEELERDRLDRHLGQEEQEGEHRQAERNGNRHAGEHEGEQQHEDDHGIHDPLPPFGVSPSRRTSLRRSAPLRRSALSGGVPPRSWRRSLPLRRSRGCRSSSMR